MVFYYYNCYVMVNDKRNLQLFHKSIRNTVQDHDINGSIKQRYLSPSWRVTFDRIAVTREATWRPSQCQRVTHAHLRGGWSSLANSGEKERRIVARCEDMHTENPRVRNLFYCLRKEVTFMEASCQ